MNQLPRSQKPFSDNIILAAHVLSALATFAFATATIIRLAEGGHLTLDPSRKDFVDRDLRTLV